MVIRPDAENRFPMCETPFFGDVALGNMTQWRMQFLRTQNWGMALHIQRMGLAVFGPGVVLAETVRKAFPKMLPGDAGNVADFINDQLAVPVLGRFGSYHPGCVGAGSD